MPVCGSELPGIVARVALAVIKNGQMLGVYDVGKSNFVSMGSASSIQVLGRANLVPFYNDGENGTGTAAEMSIDQRLRLANEGIVIVVVDVIRRAPQQGDARLSAQEQVIWRAR